MKIFLVSNIHFGYKKIQKDQFSYLKDRIIPYIKENYNDGDIFVHGGNIFNNRNTVNMDIINKTMDVFEELSNIIPIYIIKSENDELSSLILNRINNINIIDDIKTINNITLSTYKKDINDIEKNDIIVFNHDYINNIEFYKNILKKFKIVICTHYDDMNIKDDNIINIGSPYQLNKEHKNKKGFLVIDTDKKKVKFIKNDYSPIYLKIKINDINDLINFNNDSLKKNFIDLEINENVIEKKENLNKLNLLINKYNFNNIIYIKNQDDKPIKNVDTNNFDIKNIISKYLKDNNLQHIKNELDNIYRIHKEKF